MKSAKLKEAFSQPDTVGALTASVTDRLKKQINYAIENEKLDLLQSALQLITKLLGEQDTVSVESDKTQLPETEADSIDNVEETDIPSQEEDSKEESFTKNEKEAEELTNKMLRDTIDDSNQAYTFLKGYFAQIDEDYQGLLNSK